MLYLVLWKKIELGQLITSKLQRLVIMSFLHYDCHWAKDQIPFDFCVKETNLMRLGNTHFKTWSILVLERGSSEGLLFPWCQLISLNTLPHSEG